MDFMFGLQLSGLKREKNLFFDERTDKRANTCSIYQKEFYSRCNIIIEDESITFFIRL
jgi:hypothetical protein